jgi:acetyltransferase-like isoleucine patch superfamily enzyme
MYVGFCELSAAVSLLRRVLRQLRNGPALSHPERIHGLERASSVDPTARLTVLDANEAPASRIELGVGVFVGNRVELTAAGGGSICIDDDTSIQDSSIIAGNVQIGAHCLFGKYVFIASRGHNFRDHPEWLIRDQDAAALAHLAPESTLKRSLIRIEDDCWIAQSVVVSPGTYIGRGAVIGANAVVTSDVGPYEVHAGTPNRKIGSRLEFAPPFAIDARDDRSIPYFYRGFMLQREALNVSRRQGVVNARSGACIVLAKAQAGKLRIAGTRTDPKGELALAIAINGIAPSRHVVTSGPFTLELDIPPQVDSNVPGPLKGFTSIEIDAGSNPTPCYGIASAALMVTT